MCRSSGARHSLARCRERALPPNISTAFAGTAVYAVLVTDTCGFKCGPDKFACHVPHQHSTVVIRQSLNGFEELMGSDVLLALFTWFTDTPGDPQQVETDNRFLVV